MTERSRSELPDDQLSVARPHVSRLRAMPSEELKDLLLEFARPDVRSRLAQRAMLLTAPQAVMYYRNDDREREILDYQRRLTDSPNIADMSFRLKNKFDAGILTDNERLVLTVNAHLGNLASRICSAPFYDALDPKELPLRYVLPLDDALPIPELKEVYGDMNQRFSVPHHPSAMRKPELGLAPFELRVYSLALLVRH